MLSLPLQEKTGVTKSGLKIDIRFCDNRGKLIFFLRKEHYDNFLWIQFKLLNPVQSFQGDSLLLINESLGVPGTPRD